VAETPESPQAEKGAEASGRAYAKLTPGPGMPASAVGAHQRARIYRAMIEIVAEHGYEAVKVREVVHLASVSSRAFYENFGSKEDCFLRTYEMVTRRSSRRIVASQAGERDWRERPRLIFAAFAREMENDPEAGRLALIEAYLAGPAALERVRHVESTFAAMLAESFARAPSGIVVPPLVVEGMMEGVAHVARLRLAAGMETELPALEAELTAWVLGYLGQPILDLGALDQGAVWRNTMLEPLAAPLEPGGALGDRALILSSIAKLVAANGHGNLTLARIRSDASVSRATFKAHFHSLEDGYMAAMEQSTAGAVAQIARAQAAGRTWPGSVYRGIAALCEFVADDSLLVGVCLQDTFAPHSIGAISRQRTMTAIAEPFLYDGPPGQRPSPLVAEAVAGASGAIFQHHIVRNWARRRQVAASLAYLVLAPVIGAGPAIDSIRSEQAA
jgi:AcrR family transcriptional regulator